MVRGRGHPHARGWVLAGERLHGSLVLEGDTREHDVADRAKLVEQRARQPATHGTPCGGDVGQRRGRKIVGAFTLIVLTMVIVSGITFANKSFTQATSDKVIAELNGAIAMDHLLLEAEEQLAAMRGLLITGDVDYIDSYRAHADAFAKKLAELKAVENKGENSEAALTAIEAQMTEWQTRVAEKQSPDIQGEAVLGLPDSLERSYREKL